MATSSHSILIPRRIVLQVDVPEMLTSRAISETINVAASRLRFRLAQEAQVRIRERTEARIGKVP